MCFWLVGPFDGANEQKLKDVLMGFIQIDLYLLLLLKVPWWTTNHSKLKVVTAYILMIFKNLIKCSIDSRNRSFGIFVSSITRFDERHQYNHILINNDKIPKYTGCSIIKKSQNFNLKCPVRTLNFL